MTVANLSVHFSSATDKHNTPAHIIDLVVDCLGWIDLDPCSDSKRQPNVPALAHYTESDNGLRQPWSGKVYMNPPYGREIAKWVRVLDREYTRGNVREAIALLPARTDTRWWATIADHPVCFVRGRLRFGGATNSAPFPSAIVYLGPAPNRFSLVFGAIGHIYLPQPVSVTA